MFTDILDSLLQAALEGLSDPPERAFVGLGPQTAWDCEQMWVRAGETVPVYQEKSNCSTGFTVDVHLTIVRCVPTVDDNGQAPSVRQLNEASEDLSTDAGELYAVLQSWSPPAPAQQTLIVSWLPLGPEGGYAGGEWIVRVRVI